MAAPKRLVDLLFRFQTRCVPIAAKQGFARKERAQFRMRQVLAFPLIIEHHVQQRFKRRTRLVDTPVVEIQLSDTLLGRYDVVHTINKYSQVLQLRSQHFLAEDGVGMVKDAA